MCICVCVCVCLFVCVCVCVCMRVFNCAVELQDEAFAEEAIKRAQALAEQFMDYAWETRAYSSVNHLNIAEGV